MIVIYVDSVLTARFEGLFTYFTAAVLNHNQRMIFVKGNPVFLFEGVSLVHRGPCFRILYVPFPVLGSVTDFTIILVTVLKTFMFVILTKRLFNATNAANLHILLSER